MKKALPILIVALFLAGPVYAAEEAPRRLTRSQRVLQSLVNKVNTGQASNSEVRRLQRLNRVNEPAGIIKITPERITRRTRTRLTATSARDQARAARRDRDTRRKARLAKRNTFDNYRQEVLALTNEERAKVGLPGLTYNKQLEHSAQLHAEDMAAQNYFSHESLDGRTHSQRIKQAGYGNLSIDTCNCRSFRIHYGENIAKGHLTAKETVKGWMGSKGHRENILKTVFTELGVGYVDSHKVWVQNFGSIKVRAK